METCSLVHTILLKVAFSGDNTQLSPYHLHLLQKQIEFFSNVQTRGKQLSTLWLIFHCQSVELHHTQCQQNKHVHMVIKQRDADHKLKVAKCKQAASLHWCWSPCPLLVSSSFWSSFNICTTQLPPNSTIHVFYNCSMKYNILNEPLWKSPCMSLTKYIRPLDSSD